MRILKSHSLLKLVNSYLIDASQPSNISYLWNFGSLLLLCLVIQIITGVTLAMHYSPSVLEAFNSIEHIMRDVNNGWLVRYLHSNTASAFFFLVYLHIGRGMYYGSYKAPRTLVWVIGTVIFILMIITAFLGYWYSPKWHEFFLNISLYNVSIFINSIINKTVSINIYSSIFSLSLIIFYLDNWRLSNIKLFKYIQIITFISAPFFIFFLAHPHTMSASFINCVKDSNDIHMQGHVSVDKETGKTLGQGVYNVDSNIGLGVSVAGISSAVATGVYKSSIPPFQKAGIIMAGGVVGGVVHIIASTVNHKNTQFNSSSSNFSPNNGINNLVDLNANSSSLEILLQCINILSNIPLFLLFILSLQLFYRFIKDEPELKFLNNIFPNSCEKIRVYIYKLIKLNKNMSVIYIMLAIIILIASLSAIIYTSFELINDLDKYIGIHLEHYKK